MRDQQMTHGDLALIRKQIDLSRGADGVRLSIGVADRLVVALEDAWELAAEYHAILSAHRCGVRATTPEDLAAMIEAAPRLY